MKNKSINKFKLAKYRAEILGEFEEELTRKETYLLKEYQADGEEQATTWDGTLLWQDAEKTIPKMKTRYVEVDISEDQLSENKKVELQAIRQLRAELEKLL